MPDDIYSLFEPTTINQEQDKLEGLSATEKIKLKRQALLDYALNPNSSDNDFNQIIDTYNDEISYTVNEALDLAQCNIRSFPQLNELVNNYNMFYNRKIAPYILQYSKNSNPINLSYSKTSHYPSNPYFRDGVSNKEFNSVWNEVLKRYPLLKDSDKDLICSLYTLEELKADIGYTKDLKKEKLTEEDNIEVLNFDTPLTKGELYTYWSNLNLTYHNQYDNNVLGNISTYNVNDLLEKIKVVFITLYPNPNDFEYKLLFSNREDSAKYNNILNSLQMNSFDYIFLNIYTSNIDNTKDNLMNIMKNIFIKVLESLSKDCIFIPCDLFTYRYIFGCLDTETYYKLNKHLISNMMVSSNFQDKFNDLYNTLVLNKKKPSVKRTNNFTFDNILTNIELINFNPIQQQSTNIEDNNQQVNEISLDNITLSDVNPSFEYSNKKYSYSELEEILKTLDKYNIVYISKTIGEYRGKLDKKNTPYVVLRNGKDKRLYYVEPEIKLGYSISKVAKAEEPLENLYVYDNVKYSDIFKVRSNIRNQWRANGIEPKFYNDDFICSTYIASHIRNRLHYQEGNTEPRIGILDFETEQSAITVRYNSETIDAKCRLISLFDIMDSTVYCAVLKDNNYHKDINLSDIKEHDGYKVIINEFYDERELWIWLNKKLYELDFDILSGWNVEKFDLTYAIVRCRTLGLPFRNKYSDFKIMELQNEDYAVGVDGCVILDYQKLYKACKQGGSESWKLEYVCQQELKKGKRQLIVEDHDTMYYKYLREYILYNIEDDERIYDLEKKTNYIKFNYEICNVCNISWDDIYSKTRMIDGLVYNYAWDNHKTLLQSRSHEPGSSNIQKNLIDDLNKFITENNIDLIDNDRISLRYYIDNTIINLDPDEKGYEGAIVLTPQKGIHDFVADLDASQMYPRLMIRSNIFIDTLAGMIAYDNENMAEKWIYDRDNFPTQIPIKIFDSENKEIMLLTKEQFANYLQDKILTPFGTMYYKPEVKRSLVSNILFSLIENRNKYTNLKEEATKEYTRLEQLYGVEDSRVIDQQKLIERYENLTMAYKGLINSFYGAMGQPAYRLFSIFSAASITASGRELTRMVAHYGSMYLDEMITEKKIHVEFEKIPLNCKTLKGFENVNNRPNALYGDTDSSFFWIGKVLREMYIGQNLSDTETIHKSWEIINQTSEFINKYIIKFILEKKGIDFNDVDSAYNYEYKKEWIARKILIGDNKKQYAIWYAFMKGAMYDAIKVAGMTTIKSDTPRYSREFSSGVIDYILKEYDPNNVIESNRILKNMYKQGIEKAQELMDQGSITIARPVTLSQNLNSYVNIASSIRGMLIYQLIYGYEFLPGQKGYQFDINDINYSKLGIDKDELKKRFITKYSKYSWYNKMMKTCTDELLFSSITVPVDVDNLDMTIFTIDKNAMTETVIKKKVKKIYDIVGITELDEQDSKPKRSRKKKVEEIDDFLLSI